MESLLKKELKLFSKDLLEVPNINPSQFVKLRFSGNFDDGVEWVEGFCYTSEGIRLKVSDNLEKGLINFFDTNLHELFRDKVDEIEEEEIYSFSGNFMINCSNNELKIFFEYAASDQYEGEMSEEMDEDEIANWVNIPKTIFSCNFSGGGDSGDIDSWSFEPEIDQELYKNKFLNFIFNKLENFYPGWEINDGATGKGYLDLYKNTWSMNIVQYDTIDKELDNDLIFSY
jgi:hypothetical protein